MLFLGKLMKQTWNNGKKPSFRPDFCPFWPKFGLQKTFLWVLLLLDVWNCYILSWHAMSREINEPNLRKWQKTSFGSDFSLFGPNLGPKITFRQFYLYYMFNIVASYHCMQIQGTLINKFEKMAKKLVVGAILAHLAQIGCTKFFFKNLAPSVTRYYGRLPSCTISERTNDPILRKLIDRWRDGQTDNSDFIGCCPTNVECPIVKKRVSEIHQSQIQYYQKLIWKLLITLLTHFHWRKH